MKIDLGIAIMAGLGLGILPALGAYKVAQYRNKRFVLPLRVAIDQNSDTTSLPGLSLSNLTYTTAPDADQHVFDR